MNKKVLEYNHLWNWKKRLLKITSMSLILCITMKPCVSNVLPMCHCVVYEALAPVTLILVVSGSVFMLWLVINTLCYSLIYCLLCAYFDPVL